MGYYIELPECLHKADQLVKLHKAEIIPRPAVFSDIPKDKALICVLQNGLFDAAGLAYDEREFMVFSETYTGRIRDWLFMDKKSAHELAGYKGD